MVTFTISYACKQDYYHAFKLPKILRILHNDDIRNNYRDIRNNDINGR